MATASQGLLKSELSSKYIKRSIKNRIPRVPLSSRVEQTLCSRKPNNFRKTFAGWEWKWYRLPWNLSHPESWTCTLTGRQAACPGWPLSLSAPVFSYWKALMVIWKAAAASQLCLPMAEHQPGYCFSHILGFPSPCHENNSTPEYLERLYPREIF